MSTAVREALMEQALSALASIGVERASVTAAFFVPGRIEVLGKHTDYAGGRSLLAAVDRGFVIAAARRRDRAVRVIDASSGAMVVFAGEGAHGAEGATGWATYPAAVVRRCALNFPGASDGADIAFASNLPQAAGLSSSSALVVATFLTLDAVRGIADSREYRETIHSREDLAGYLGAVENGMDFGALRGDSGVGTMGGSEDHTAILCAREGGLVQYSYAPVRFERAVALPDGWTFVVASSGVRAEKTGAALGRYNRLSAATQRLVELWRDSGAGAETTLAAILAADPAALRLREVVRARAPAEAEALSRRLAQFMAESEEIVPAASAALERGDMAAFGKLVQRSQFLAEHALDNQVPETVFLVESALRLGAAAASAFGAGFGGSVWALVRATDGAAFADAWRSGYVARHPDRAADAAFLSTTAAGPATALDLPSART